MHIQAVENEKLRYRFEGGRTQCPLESAVEQASTVGSLYDPAVEITTIRNNASFAMPAVIRSFTIGLFRH
jgi:hypothetical protein